MHPQQLERVNEIIGDFRPGLVLNRVRRQKDIVMGDNLLKLVKRLLSP